RRGVGHAVAGADDEVGETVPAARAPGRRGLRCFGRRLGWRGGAALRARLRRAAKRRLSVLCPLSSVLCLRLLCLFLLAAGGAEQLGVDDEADLGGLAEDFASGGGEDVVEALLQPFLEVAVGHADRQDAIVPGELGMAIEPELVARLAND